MKKLVAPAIAVMIALVVISVASLAFNPTERQTIKLLKQRLSALEANQNATAADIDTLEANQITNNSSIFIIDEGLKGLVAPDGPLAAIDQNLADLQEVVWAAHPPITFSEIQPVVVCDAIACTATIEWSVNPPATGQVEWGETTAYGNKTTLETRLLPHHKQTISNLPLNKTYNFRLLATTPEAQAMTPDLAPFQTA